MQYFEPKHTILFTVALLVLLILGIPYTLILTAAPWIQRSQFRWVSSLYNKFKPLFDAYMGPYKDNCRYWTGMLLLARVVLIVLFSSLSNTDTASGPQLNLLFLTLSSSALLSLTAALRPYKEKLLNGLEMFYLTILLIFSASNLYVSNLGSRMELSSYIYIVLIGASCIVFLVTCVGHIWYRIQTVRPAMKQGPPPPEREMEECRHQWYRARVRGQEWADTLSTVRTTNNTTSDAERRHSAFRESVLELS